ncbi:hypothetical protein [Enterococcus ureasiticus]|uniref:Uncharacterized protein n=1 Tax=Enterococcus ureasiticus TaxID=903984 RepID=A0A1E5G9S3_9ENTE|nr:hypothetical protein [Enterococcus ureasiticus]OEG09010.1 hypothetical protein BCR21_15660 [Enterococcus ureasiticus]
MLIKNKKYHLIKEQELIAIYNIQEQKVEKLIKVDPLLIECYLEVNSTKAIAEQQEKYHHVLTNLQKAWPDLIVDMDGEKLEQLIELEEAAREFARLNHHYFSLKEEMIFINVKETLSFYTVNNFSKSVDFKFSLLKDIHQYTAFSNKKKGEQKEINLIDIASFEKEELQYFETMMLRDDSIRIYYYNTVQDVVLGEGLVGSDYGCLFCNKDELPDTSEITAEVSSLIASLLQFEIIKYNRNLLAFLNEDITLTKGKKFLINKSTFEAQDIHIKRSSVCTCCAGGTVRKVV